jgi:imidazoleglycerol phosphate dehydratase HisB
MPDGSVRIEELPEYGLGNIVNTKDPAKVPKVAFGSEHQTARTTQVIRSPDVVEFRKWIKFGNTAIRIDEHMYEVRMTVSNANRELYPTDEAWRDSIKKNMALELAQEIIGEMSFFREHHATTDTSTIIGSAVVFNLNEVKLYMESTVPLDK